MKACGHVLAKHSQTRLDLTPGAIVCHPLGSALRRVVKDKTDPKSRQQCREEGGPGSWEPPVGGAGMRRGGLGSGRELGREAARRRAVRRLPKPAESNSSWGGS